MIHVVAALTFRPAARDRFVEEFRWLTPLVRAEEGCIEYSGVLEYATGLDLQEAPREDVLMVVEKWTDEAALGVHLGAPHMAEFGMRVDGMIVRREIRVAREI